MQFIGILVRDDVASAKAFNRKVGITYPSIDDYSNRNGLGFASSLPAQAIPTTWIIDAEGRVAVRIVSENLTASTLSGLIDDVTGRCRVTDWFVETVGIRLADPGGPDRRARGARLVLLAVRAAAAAGLPLLHDGRRRAGPRHRHVAAGC